MQRGERNQALEIREHLVVDDDGRRKAGPAVHDAVADRDGLVAGVMRPQPSGDPDHCRRHVRDLAGAEALVDELHAAPVGRAQAGRAADAVDLALRDQSEVGSILDRVHGELDARRPGVHHQDSSTLGYLSPEPALRASGLLLSASVVMRDNLLALVQICDRPPLTGKERATAGAAAPRRR